MTPEQAFEQHHRAVYRFVYRLVGQAELAEDITQDCFLFLIREPKRYDSRRADLKTFLFSIARNLALKRYRDDHGDRHIDQDSVALIAEPQSDRDLALAVAQMVSQLPELQREALILFEYEGFALDEIGQIVGADVGVVKSRLHRARERLKNELAPYRKVRSHEHV